MSSRNTIELRTQSTFQMYAYKHWTMDSLEVELWCEICLNGIYWIWLNISEAIVVTTKLIGFMEIVNSYHWLDDQWPSKPDKYHTYLFMSKSTLNEHTFFNTKYPYCPYTILVHCVFQIDHILTKKTLNASWFVTEPRNVPNKDMLSPQVSAR